jgi:hypothetical protein
MNRLSPRTNLYNFSEEPSEILINNSKDRNKDQNNPNNPKTSQRQRSQSRKKRDLLSANSKKNSNQAILKTKYLKGSGELGKAKASPEKASRFNIHNMKKWLYMDSTISKSSMNGEDTGLITGSNLRELNGEIFKRKLDGGIQESGPPQVLPSNGIWYLKNRFIKVSE